MENKEKKFFILFYFVLAICLTITFLGIQNFNFTNIKWLFIGNDISGHQTGWHFFKEDIWRFPLGSNPNYGDKIGNSIIYSDSIPLLAFIFKLFNFLIPEKFQYFSFWFLLCFFFQGILSQQLIYKYTNNRLFSLIGSFFFIFFPIAIHRMGFHPALFGQWTLIITIYLILDKDENKEKLWVALILFTSLIHFYFTVINLIVYNFFKLYSTFIERKINYQKYFKDLIVCHGMLILLMYSIGYFEVRVVDTLAVGFGVYKLNLLSFFDSTNSVNNISWSWFLPDIILSHGEELEGFNYFGFGGLILISSMIFFSTKKKLRNKFSEYLDKKILLILIIFFILSLSNNISIGSWEIIQIPLNKYIYGIFSIVRSSGRLFWLVSYFLLFLSLFIIYEKFSKKNSSLIILFILILQLVDTSSGIKDYINLKKFNDNDKYILKDDFWYTDLKNVDKIITTKPNNYNKNFDYLAYYIVDKNFSKTNIVKTARVDREKAALNRYSLNKEFLEKKIEIDTVYVVDNLGHLLSLREIFKEENVGFFYRDNIWTLVKNKKDKMNELDTKKLNNLRLPLLDKEKIEINEKSDFLGFGWTHNLNGKGAWSEGNFSNLLFKVKKTQNVNIQIECEPFINEKIDNLNLKVLVNGNLIEEIKFKFDKDNLNKVKLINITVNKNLIENDKINLQFVNENAKSPLDILQSPDSRKIGFLIKNISLI